jgi:uracil-DNA glycosylase family 4
MTLHLDDRQRAMLAEMGVRVWLPASSEGASPSAAAPSVVEEAPRPVTAPQSVPAHVAHAAHVQATPAPPAVMALPAVDTPPKRDLAASRPAGVDRMDWVELQAAVAGCQACALCQTRHHTVFGVGAPAPQTPPGQAPQVDWLIVGEAPGENEDVQGEPFVGQAGKLLDNMLKACGLSRHAERGPQGGGVYIVNVLKCRPPGNRNPRPEEVAQCEPFLQRQVALLKPKIIVAMGRFAVQSLLAGSVADVESQPLGKLRGRVYSYEGVPVVVTYHPAYLLRSLADKSKAWADLCLAMAQMQKPVT